MAGRGLENLNNAKLAKAGRLLTKSVVVVNVGNDLAEGISGEESIGKTILDLTITGVAVVEGGPVTFTGAVLYGGVDAFYPGGVTGLSTDVIK